MLAFTCAQLLIKFQIVGEEKSSTRPVICVCVPSQLVVSRVQGCVKSWPQEPCRGRLLTAHVMVFNAGTTINEPVPPPVADPLYVPYVVAPHGSMTLLPHGQDSWMLVMAMGPLAGLEIWRLNVAKKTAEVTVLVNVAWA